MPEPKVGQEWLDPKTLQVWKVLDVLTYEMRVVEIVDADRHRVTMVVDPEVFLKGKELITSDGKPVERKAREFQVGDLVRLKCGGPPMVVCGVTDAMLDTLYHLQDGTMVIEDFMKQVAALVLIHEVDCESD